MKKIKQPFLALLFFCSSIAAADYYVVVNGQQQGPHSLEKLQMMKNAGALNADSLVWKDGMPAWQKAGTQSDLQRLFAAVTPPPLPSSGSTPPALPEMDMSASSPAVSAEEKKDTSIHNFPKAEEIAGNNLEKQMTQYLKAKGYRLGFNDDGSYIGWSDSTIEGDRKSIDFGQKRIAAFEKAFADAKGEFVATKKMKVSVSVGRKFFETDISEDEYDHKDGRLKNIGKKILAVSEAGLDKMLVELGVDPKTVENSDITKKRTLAEDSFDKTVTLQSVQAVPGIIILATFEDLEGVGVLIKQKQRYAGLAKAIASRKLAGYPSSTNPVDNIASQIDQAFTDDVQYLPQYGVRIMTDEVGNRVLVSFGQWSPKVTASDSKMKINMAVKSAKEIANNQSIAYMSQFINTTLALEKTSRLQDSNMIREITREAGNTEPVETSDVGASLDRFIKETSNVTVEGIVKVNQWAVNHPETGHLIVGAVNMWSPTTQEMARKNTSNLPKPAVRKPETKGPSTLRQSRDLNDADF